MLENDERPNIIRCRIREEAVTPDELAKRRAVYASMKRDENLRDLRTSVPLLCDLCRDQIGYANENDFNGSRFFCAWCKAHPDEEAVR